MKKFLLATALTFSLGAQAGYVELTTGLGDYALTPGWMGYPTYPGDGVDYYTWETGEGPFSYIGWRYTFTDTFKYMDADKLITKDDTIDGDFTMQLFAGVAVDGREQLIGERTFYENDNKNWYSGSFYNEKPTEQPFNYAFIRFTPFYGNDNPISNNVALSFNFTRGEFVASADQPLGFVPETGTFALFLLGAVGLCVRRQMKQQA